MINPVAITRSIDFPNTEAAKKRGSVPKGNPPFHATLPFVEPDQLLGALPDDRDVGSDNEFRLAGHLSLDGGFDDADRPTDGPDVLVRRRAGARPPPPGIPNSDLHLEVELQPERCSLLDLVEGDLRIDLTGKRALLQHPETLFPDLPVFFYASMEGGLLLF
jgi:hypothetical protein